MAQSNLPTQAARAAVLVVDDDPVLLRATSRLLKTAGFDVTECNGGLQALELIEARTFDVVVSDIDMPGLSGTGLLKRLRGNGVEIPVILMTGAPSLDSAVQAVEHGACKYLMKPVVPEDLRDAIDKAISSQSGVRRAAASSGRAGSSEAEYCVVSRSALSAGALLGDRYRVGQLLGEGGMSQVWEAEQLRTGRQVAVKVLHASLNAKDDMRRRLMREARAASQVGHPNVVDILDAFELPDGTPVLVMALLRGETLDARLAAAGKLPLAEAAEIFVPVVSAVGTAHARGVVHRDLKPENIFLADEDGRTIPKILDFGIAKLLRPDAPGAEIQPLTATGTFVGTLGYMSPEQCTGEHDLDVRADIWSLGAILYKALSGRHPVEAENVAQMLKLLFTKPVPPLRDQAPDVPATLATIIDRMLATEREQRPADLRELHAELSRYTQVSVPLFGGPSSTRSPVSASMPRSEPRLAFAPTELGSQERLGSENDEK